jgi:N-dimethylarginine dimethylaminohydrolase
MGIEWLARHLGDGYRVHEIQNLSPEAIHIDTTFIPLAPGKVFIEVERTGSAGCAPNRLKAARRHLEDCYMPVS